jgi:hypothetical protein
MSVTTEKWGCSGFINFGGIKGKKEGYFLISEKQFGFLRLVISESVHGFLRCRGLKEGLTRIRWPHDQDFSADTVEFELQ